MTQFVQVVKHDSSKSLGRPILIHLSVWAHHSRSGHRARSGNLVRLAHSGHRAHLASSGL